MRQGTRKYPICVLLLEELCHILQEQHPGCVVFVRPIGERTVKRWVEKGGGYTAAKNGKLGLSEDQYAAFQKYYAPKNQNKDLRQRGKALGLSEAAIERRLKPDRRKNKSWKSITADLERSAAHKRRQKGEEADTGSNADQIAEAEALLYDLVPGSTAYVELQDYLQWLRMETTDRAALMTEART